MVEIIAEVGSVHDGSIGNALKLVDLCKEVGADTVKFQTHIAEFETTKNAPSPKYFKSENRYDYFERTAFSEHEWRTLKEYCAERKIGFLSSPFSIEAAQLLKNIGSTSFKIASGEVSNVPLLDFINDAKNTVYISSGMSSFEELRRSLGALQNCAKVVLLQCTSEYPCPPEKVGINLINAFKSEFSCEIGFSDHFPGNSASICAVAHGAEVIEKHITFSRKMYGSDASNAMEPEEFKRFVFEVRQAEAIMKHPIDKDEVDHFSEMKTIFEKSIYLKADMSAGQRISRENFSYLKPSVGISAARYKEIEGSTLLRSLPAGSPLFDEDISK